MPFFAFLGVVALIVSAGVAHGLMHLAGGVGTYTRLVYALAAFIAPVSIIRIIVPGLWLPLWLYDCLLTVLALKAIQHASWKPSLMFGLPLATLLSVQPSVLVVAGITWLALIGPTVSKALASLFK